jgi:hypothetical protein
VSKTVNAINFISQFENSLEKRFRCSNPARLLPADIMCELIQDSSFKSRIRMILLHVYGRTLLQNRFCSVIPEHHFYQDIPGIVTKLSSFRLRALPDQLFSMVHEHRILIRTKIIYLHAMYRRQVWAYALNLPVLLEKNEVMGSYYNSVNEMRIRTVIRQTRGMEFIPADMHLDLAEGVDTHMATIDDLLSQSVERSQQVHLKRVEKKLKRVKTTVITANKIIAAINEYYKEKAPTKSSVWSGKVRGQLNQYIKYHDNDPKKAFDVIQFCMDEWNSISFRIKMHFPKVKQPPLLFDFPWFYINRSNIEDIYVEYLSNVTRQDKVIAQPVTVLKPKPIVQRKSSYVTEADLDAYMEENR